MVEPTSPYAQDPSSILGETLSCEIPLWRFEVWGKGSMIITVVPKRLLEVKFDYVKSDWPAHVPRNDSVNPHPTLLSSGQSFSITGFPVS